MTDKPDNTGVWTIRVRDKAGGMYHTRGDAEKVAQQIPGSTIEHVTNDPPAPPVSAYDVSVKLRVVAADDRQALRVALEATAGAKLTAHDAVTAVTTSVDGPSPDQPEAIGAAA